MDPSFWHERWRENRIGFHLTLPNPLLVRRFGALGLKEGARVFVPLCGKTRDIAWLLSEGYRVAGAELSQIAIDQLFAELDMQPEVSDEGGLRHHRAPRIDIFVGDILALTPEALGPIDAVYDRAALVALPPDVRPRYAEHIVRLTAAAPQLLVSYEYDQTIVPGPPFSVPPSEIDQLYGARFMVTTLETVDLPAGMKGKADAVETVSLLETHLKPSA
jgi:thiopurine S-methyltransferase